MDREPWKRAKEPVPFAPRAFPPKRRDVLTAGAGSARSLSGEPTGTALGDRFAGVAVALAATTGISVTLVRLAFLLLTLATGVAPVVYVVLWLVLPNDPGELSPIGRLTRRVVDEPAGAPAPLTRFLDWLRPKLSHAGRWLRGERRSPEGSS